MNSYDVQKYIEDTIRYADGTINHSSENSKEYIEAVKARAIACQSLVELLKFNNRNN